ARNEWASQLAFTPHMNIFYPSVGTQKKVNLTGSVGLATAKEIEARPVANATRDHPQRCEQVPIKGNAGRKVIVHAHAHPKH
ncbi:hypothetical protein, partial [Bilophila wadsworthia]|uniref:hypothetical protein n=1 Tax=Bilophila wadsworthia TaxID=35833 RepID=UPI003AB11054